ncbi:ABC transporter ATP-binding protein [Fictibacillus macauensis ZFHKF-1]|uniref:ABC transporter ATP-binding protein n=1 Tax=Fictibacillus macauensis ZFHKF-1 TaxID=1196324 RepID=I8J3A5_9BACL|nr:ABC transporter ATP-binding protein [Fictibacillus macauensis]EIT86241.1 ABC transporter ATP-binding protein [Fictibacillus macauensis ZFHKF-1]
MITFSHVTKSYNGKRKAVDDLHLTVNGGEVFGFLGPNGAGKTTTIKMLTGITDIDEGSIEINGYNITSDSMKAKRSFGYVPDSPDMFLRLKGLEYLNFMGDIYKVPKSLRQERISSLASAFDLESALGDHIQSYSHGMRQKVMVMGALLHDPDVWILDEPLTGLDPKAAFELKKMMRDHANKGKTVFFSTHGLDVVEKLCDRVAIINKGQIVLTGTMDEIKGNFHQDDSLEKLFLEITKNE